MDPELFIPDRRDDGRRRGLFTAGQYAAIAQEHDRKGARSTPRCRRDNRTANVQPVRILVLRQTTWWYAMIEPVNTSSNNAPNTPIHAASITMMRRTWRLSRADGAQHAQFARCGPGWRRVSVLITLKIATMTATISHRVVDDKRLFHDAHNRLFSARGGC